MRKHGITENQLERVFHLDGQIDVIATPPGKNKREQTINAYFLIGAQHLLQSDDSKFTEADAVRAMQARWAVTTRRITH